MKLQRLFFDNYKTLVNFQVDFSDTNILIGPNGSGKSTAFQVLQILKDFIISGKRINELLSSDTVTRWQNAPFQTFEMVDYENEHEFRYKLEHS